MPNTFLLAMIVVLVGAILGMESLARIVRDLLQAGPWAAVVAIVIVVIGGWSLDRLVIALVHVIKTALGTRSGGSPK